MRLCDIKKLMPDNCNLELCFMMNDKCVQIKLNNDDLALSDEDLKDRILNPVIQTLNRIAKNDK